MTVLIGGPTEEHSGLLYEAWRHCLLNQTVETEFHPIYDAGEEEGAVHAVDDTAALRRRVPTRAR